MTRRDRRRATTGALAASVLIHLALFAWFASQAIPRLITPPEAPEPDFTVTLEPAPPMLTPPAHPRTAVLQPVPPRMERPIHRVTASPPRIAAPATPAVQAKPRPAPRNAPSAPPTPPARASANIPAAGAPSASAKPSRPANPWAVEPDDGQDGVRGFLRATVGCSHEDYAHLNEAERAACDRRIGRDARIAAERVDGLSEEARASFDAAVQARDRMRKVQAGAMGAAVTPCRGEPGSNMDRGCLNPQGGAPRP